MADEFLEEKKEEVVPEQPTEETKIKVGEKEFSQAELDELVKLGGIAKEYEEKYDRPISKYYPEFTKSQQKVKELETKLQELENTPKPTQDGEVDVKTQALKQAKELGLITVEDINTYIDNRILGKELREDIDSIIETAKTDGKPVPQPEELLNYMENNGVRNPNTAYKLMYESELDSWKEQKLKTIKPEGFKTQESSTAGQTKPIETKIAGSKDELAEQLRSFMKRQEGSENA